MADMLRASFAHSTILSPIASQHLWLAFAEDKECVSTNADGSSLLVDD
jgi:hypothetical protein